MLKDIIKTKGYKQKWIAQKLGVSEVTVSNWVKGKSVPTKENYEKLSELFNIPLNELMNG